MYAPHILTAALAATAPAERTPVEDDFESQLDQVELLRDGDAAQFVAYDSAGEVMGTIAIWVERDGRIYLASDYDDGYAETIVTSGVAHTEATLRPEVIATRAEAMAGALVIGRSDTGPQEGWGACVFTAVGAVGACAGAAATGGLALAACPAAAGWATCECITAVAEEVGGRPCDW